MSQRGSYKAGMITHPLSRNNSFHVLFAGVLLFAAAACSSSDDGSSGAAGSGGEAGAAGASGSAGTQNPGGTIEVGAECVATRQCKNVPGKEVMCGCSPQSDTPVCRLLLDPGEPCPEGEWAAACRSDSRCINVSGALECVAYAKLGESCTEDTICGPGTTCESAKCVAAHAVGGACSHTEPQPCTADAFCGVDKVCVARAGDGEPCGMEIACVAGAACAGTDFSDMKCYVPKPDGEPCSVDFECLAGSSCDAGDGGTLACTLNDWGGYCSHSSNP